MKKNILLLIILFSLSIFCNAQVGQKLDFQLPQGYKPLSINISGNSMGAIILASNGTEKKVFEYKNEKGVWGSMQENEILNELIKQDKNVNSPSYTSTTSVIYFSAKNVAGNNDIYKMVKISGKWQEPQALSNAINTTEDELTPSLSNDAHNLYFTRKNTSEDCGTIYMSTSIDDIWQEAVKLPEPINLGCETSPYIAPDNTTLYLASKRADGKGEWDIYKCKRFTEKVWILPTLVDTINTSGIELYPAYDAKNNQIVYYFQDSKKANINGIYSMSVAPMDLPDKLYRFYGTITDLESKQAISNAKIIVSDPESSRVITQILADNNSEYDFCLKDREKGYFFDFVSDNYSHHFKKVESKELKDTKEDIQLFKDSYLTLNIFDSQMFEPTDMTITIKADKNSIAKKEKVSTGRYSIKLPVGDKYHFSLSHPTYNDYNFDLDLTQTIIYNNYEKDIEIISLKRDVNFVVSGVNQPVDINVINQSTTNKFTSTITTKDNKASISLRSGDKYVVECSPIGYTFFSTEIDFSDKSQKTPVTVNIELQQLKNDITLDLKNILFENNSSDLQEESFEELNRVVALMEKNFDINIEISAHTDNVGSKQYNQKLSERRAESAVEYIKSRGISAKRIISKGYGMDKPKVPNTSDENRAINRRVELKVISNN